VPTAAQLDVRFSADTSDFDRGARHVEDGMKGMVGNIGTALATGAGFVLGTAVTKVIGSVDQLIGAGLDFGKQMSNVNSIAQLSTDQLGLLSDQVLDLANNPAITQMPNELAAGLYNVYSSGFQGADGMQVLEASAIAATAGLTTTDVAARAVTAVLNAFKLEASDSQHVSDLLFQTVNDGVITFEELANNMGSTIPMANALGVSLENLFAAYAQLTLQGINASAAETDIAALMKTALAPTEALTAAVQEQGFETADQALKTLDLAGYVQLLDNYSKAHGVTLMDLLGTQEAVNGALALGGDNAAAYAGEIDNMNHATDGAGATNKALTKQMESASFQIDKFRQTVVTMATALVYKASPSIAKFFAAGTSGLLKFQGWVKGIYDGYNRLRNLKPIGVMNKLGILGPDGALFTSQMGRITALTTVLAARFKALTGINADQFFRRLGVSILRPYDAAKKLLDSLSAKNWNKGLEGVGDALSIIPKTFGDMLKSISTGNDTLDGILLDTGRLFTGLGRLIQETGQRDWDGFRLVLGRVGDALGDVGTDLLDVGRNVGGGILNAAFDIAPSVANWLWDVGSDFASWVAGKATDLAKDAISQVPATLEILAGWGGALFDGATVAAGWIVSHIGTLAAQVPGYLQILGQWAGAVYDGALDAAGWIAGKIGALAAQVPGYLQILGQWAGAVYDGALDAASWIGSHIGTLASQVPGYLQVLAQWAGVAWGELGDFASWFKVNLPGLAADGINATISTISAWGGNVWGSYEDFQAWFRAGVGELKASVNVSVDTISADPETGQAAYESGQDTGKNIFERFISGSQDGMRAVANLLSGGGGDGGDGGGGHRELPNELLADWAVGLALGLGQALYDEFTKELGIIANPFRDLPGKISGWWNDAIHDDVFGANGSQDPAQGYVENGLPFLDGFKQDIENGFSDFVSDLTDPFTDLPGKVDEWIGGALGSIATSTQSFAGDIKALIESVVPDAPFHLTLPDIDIPLGPVATVVNGAIAGLNALSDGLEAAWNNLQFWKDRTKDDGTVGPKERAGLQGLEFGAGTGGPAPGGGTTRPPDDQTQPVPARIVYTVDADTTPAQTKINDLAGLFGGGSGQKVGPGGSAFTVPVDVEIDRSQAGADLQAMVDGMKGQYKAQIGADTTPLIDALAQALMLGTAWDGATFDSAILGADYTAVDQASQVAWILGNTWAGSTHESTFSADYTQVGNAYSTAFLMGNTWAGQTFTARFAVDTSPLLAASATADAVAAHIAAVMPHSPAKEGPLKEPIDFSYIAQNMEATADRLGRAADLGASRVGGAFSDRYSIGASASAGSQAPTKNGDTYNITIIAPESEEYSQIARDARRGKVLAVNLTELMRNV
jgi:TP901 family phage tail tape measure protein